MTQYVYSTHTNATRYVKYVQNTKKNHNVVERGIVINGGHGMCNRNLITSEGAVTIVKDEELEWLLTVEAFQDDIKKGFIRHSKRKEDSERVVQRDMNPRDGSAPLSPKDYIVVDANSHTYRSKNSTQPAGPV